MTIPLEVRRKVVVRGVNWVGDSVIATPALRRLRRAFKDSHITLIVRPWCAAIYEHSPDIDDLWVHDDSTTKGLLQTAARMRKEKFDFGIALNNSFRSALLLTLGQVKRRVGYARSKRSLLLTKALPLDKKLLEDHEVYYYLNLVNWLSDEKPDAPQLVLVPGDREWQEASAILKERGVQGGRMWIGIAPGAINSEAKLWLPERFAALADRFHNEAKAEVMLLGSASEKKVLDKVESLCKTPVCNLAGVMNLGQTIALMSRLHAFVGNDSGAMHMAAGLGVPTVAIFGPTNWKTTAPFSTKSRIVRHQVDCQPCMLRDCPIDHPCMTGVSVEDVVRSFSELANEVKARMKTQPQSQTA